MAESVLYGNHNEPEFPFDQVVNNLKWLGPYLSTCEKAKVDTVDVTDFFASLLDTVLVWSRARTAGFQRNVHYPDCKELALLLNATLKQAGPSAYYHRLEFAPCGATQFFVTCRNSPRFIWKTRFTHLDVGRNIDFCATGHLGGHPESVPRAFVEFIERSTFHHFSGEAAYFEALQDPTARERWIHFNKAKEQLYNETMEKLGLKYRFKCIFEFPQTHHEIRSVMTRTTPPSTEWWDDHCYDLHRIGEMGSIRVGISFCDFQTRYYEYWELIRCVYSFGLKYFPLVLSTINAHCRFDFSERLRLLLLEVRAKTAERMTPDEYELLLNHTRHELEDLAGAAEDYLEWQRLHEPKKEKKSPGYRERIGDYMWIIVSRVKSSGLDLYIHLFQRWRLRKPLVYNGLPIPDGRDHCAYEVLDK